MSEKSSQPIEMISVDQTTVVGLKTRNLLHDFKETIKRKRLMVKRAQATRNRLMIITKAFQQLATDEIFTTMLQDENLVTMPACIAARVAYFEVSQA
ncbi:MAG: Chromosome partitioning protein ParB [Sphingomonadales bacterium]|nr:Chromosome partitioning protein ParB [Sphingomonadales bacterium]